MTEEHIDQESSGETFLLSGNPLLQKLFSGSYVVVLLRLMTPGGVVMLLAFAFGVASIPVIYADGSPTNVGIF